MSPQIRASRNLEFMIVDLEWKFGPSTFKNLFTLGQIFEDSSISSPHGDTQATVSEARVSYI